MSFVETLKADLETLRDQKITQTMLSQEVGDSDIGRLTKMTRDEGPMDQFHRSCAYVRALVANGATETAEAILDGTPYQIAPRYGIPSGDPVAVLRALADLTAKLGGLQERIARAEDDGVIEAFELLEIEEEARKLLNSVAGTLEGIRKQHLRDFPGSGDGRQAGGRVASHQAPAALSARGRATA